MGTIVSFPEASASRAWRQYSDLVRQIRARPMLADDPEHFELRQQAYRRFMDAFDGGAR